MPRSTIFEQARFLCDSTLTKAKLMRILAMSAAVVFAIASTTFAEASKSSQLAKEMTTAAQNYIAGLSKAQMKRGVLPFDHEERTDWTNVPKATRKGIQLREMPQFQRDLCFKLIESSLSPEGYQKARWILALENNLLEDEKGGGPFRDPLRYFMTIFGTPSMEGTWGYSFEGHHLSLNFVIKDGVVIGETPSFWGACPATVKTFIQDGPPVGTRTLANEEQLGFDLLASMTEAQLKKTVIANEAPGDYRNNNKPNPPSTPGEGISAAELNDAQKAILWKLLETYSNHLAPAISEVQLKEIKDAGFDHVHFAWLGGTKPGIPHYYRVEGPTFVLELINVQNDPQGNPANHIHSVWRSLKHDFGFNTAAK